MAITGTGTQADPYIVDTWSDFVTAVGTQGAYVEVVPETVWEMNKIAPNGVGNINDKCQEVNGHGVIIQAANVTGSAFFVFSQAATFRRMNFESITSQGRFCMASQNATFKKISIDGVYNAINDCFVYADEGYVSFEADAPEYEGEKELGCGIAIKMNNGSGFGGSYSNGTRIFVESSSIYYEGNNFDSPYGRYRGVGIYDSYITGRLGTANFYTARRSIINASGTIARDNNGGDANITQTVVNADLATISSGPFIAVTDAQLKDASYLSSIGIPIGVEI